MAARKLQTEIDRTLKKVAEGVEVFESIYDKMQASSNQTQKEKLETDLKTQIKKLQRLRDQIKTWVASNDIKDKSALLENRKLIETVSTAAHLHTGSAASSDVWRGRRTRADGDTPLFRQDVCVLTTLSRPDACSTCCRSIPVTPYAYSANGEVQSLRERDEDEGVLQRGSHASVQAGPEAAGEGDTMTWVQQMMDDLMVQVETAEAEIETLQGGGKKKNKAGGAAAERLETLERLNERRKWHISRLEIILRLLDNGSLPTEKVLALQDDVKYFVENNMEDDFDEYEEVYDDLNLDEEEEKFRLPADDNDSEESETRSEDIPIRTPVKKHDDDSPSSKRDHSPVLKKAGTTLQQRKQSIVSETAKPPPHANFAQQSVASMVKTTPAPPPRNPPSGYAKVAAAAVAPPQSAASQPSASSSAAAVPPTPTASNVSSSAAADQQSAVTSSPSLTHPSVTSPMLSSAASVSHQPDDSVLSAHASPALHDAVPSSIGGPAATSSPQRQSARKASLSSPTSLQPPGVPVRV
ncbi:hypothetical protein NUW54_g9723 [Trametes sanguinea]|uniref:Uncharacterized protein n=1 Tax=Trametes sanguinea TaxID=158606 RepID=A0ACC1P6Y8_9APHY|nr:hypothetical protein NUW54_g9723 [Trametes sanguinea]